MPSNALSPTPTTSHSFSSATPGNTAIGGSPAYSATARCTANTATRFFRPMSAAVTSFGARSNFCASSAVIFTAGSGAPPIQSRWIASIASMTNVQRAVDRRAGAREDADHRERLVGMVGARDHAGAVAERDALAEPVAARLGDLGADHHVVELRGVPSKALPCAKPSGWRSPYLKRVK